MLNIAKITDDPQQKQTVVLPDGTTFTINLYYVQMQYAWFISSLTCNDFTMNWTRVFNSPNMLHQFRNQIPFGLACVTANNREPTQIEDFASGAAIIYALDEADTVLVAKGLSGVIA